MTFNEANTVEAFICDRLCGGAMHHTAVGPGLARRHTHVSGLGWHYLAPQNLSRQSHEVLVEDHLHEALIRLNPEIAAQPDRADDILYKLRAILMGVRGDGLVKANEEFAAWLTGERSMPFGEHGEHVTVRLIDFEDLERNQYVVTTQFTYSAGASEKRADLVLLVNGIPLVVIEAKTPVRASQSWFDAAVQIHEDYERNAPELFVPNVVSIATEGKEFRYGSIGLPVDRLCCNFRAATSGWTTFGKHRTGSPIMPSDNPFKWRQFEPALILQCVRWYLRYALSYRDLEDMMRERGLCVDHTTIYRWVQRYAPEIDKRCRPFLRRTNDSYRIDETYVRVAGAWTYLYRGVDSNGDTLDFLLRATRDRKAAIAFFRKTLGAAHTTPPRVVTVDKNPAYPVAFEAVRHEGLVRPRSNLRQCKYLNNIIEQDHRFIKRRTRPMLGFKRFTTAWRTLRGIEIMHALRKGQARWMAKGDVVGQTQLIHKVFGLAA